MTQQTTLITGGAGFVGSNLANRLLSQGRHVRILDNLSRPGVEQNLQWLRQQHGNLLEFERADVRDAAAVKDAMAGVQQVFHFAAQVAVTTSLEDPREDFEVNALGTLNVLEAARARPVAPGVILTSTNKVYGGLEDLQLSVQGQRYLPVDPQVAASGIGEDRPLDFHSPYGCSKGTADQYVVDYARSYGLTTLVFRMSCIYGPRQFGTEDQGWVAHFILRALRGERITLYGDGMQVRDALHVSDAVSAWLAALDRIELVRGRVFNLGGGPANALSLVELVERIASATGRRPAMKHADWRTGDQRWYVSDTRRFREATGWHARVGVDEGLKRLGDWLIQLHATRPPLVEEARG